MAIEGFVSEEEYCGFDKQPVQRNQYRINVILVYLFLSEQMQEHSEQPGESLWTY